MNKTTLIVVLLGLNVSLLGTLLYMQISTKSHKKMYQENLEIQKRYNYDDLMPSIIYSKDDKVDTIFREVQDNKNQNIQNCINPNVRKLSKRTEALMTCLPLFKNYKMKAKPENKKVIPSIPNFVPKFGELEKVNYNYKKVKWNKLYKRSNLKHQNLIHVLGHYENSVLDDMYNDDPQEKQDFETPHMGLFNDDNYCNTHDMLLLSNPQMALQKNFMSDYHQMGLVRMFIMNNIGQDVMPRLSKNMPKINWYQKQMSVDPRVSSIFMKNASFHAHHKIGQNFACYGQSYNHIPGHGGLIRKDLLTEISQNWFSQFKDQQQCQAELNYFPSGFRLYIRQECKNFFEVLNSPQYEEKRKQSPIQFIMKVGHGVHRGVGVHILDKRLEKIYREVYENGKKCGIISINEIAQQYIGNPALFHGHKFDLRVYMLISSVNPMKVYYHDGFLRVSLKKYDKHSNLSEVHLTNTSMTSKIIKKVKETGEKYLGMGLEEIEEFQVQTFEEYGKYLYENQLVNDPEWVKNYLIPQIKRSFIAVTKINEENFYKSSDVYEFFGVDIILDEEFNPYILEVNASPMIIGTVPKKTELLKNMVNGMFDIVFAQQFSRVERTLDYISQNREEIEQRKNLKEHKLKFEKLYQNILEKKYKDTEHSTTWQLIYDENIEDIYGRYMGLIDPQCVDLIEKSVEQKKKTKNDLNAIERNKIKQKKKITKKTKKTK